MSAPMIERLQSAETINQGYRFYLSDDLVIHILSSLLVEDVLRCRRVCKRWRDLTSTRYFVHAHSRRSGPVIMFTAFLPYYYTRRFLLSRWWEPVPTISMIRELIIQPKGLRRYHPRCLGHGLVAFHSLMYCTKFTIFNAVYGKTMVEIDVPEEPFWVTDAFAIYFHPTLKEYCVLFRKPADGGVVFGKPMDEGGNQYMILNLGSEPCWRKIRNPWIHQVYYHDMLPLLLGDRNLYWLVKPAEKYNTNFAIMEFDVLCEELKMIPSPVSQTDAVRLVSCYDNDLSHNEHINLVDVRGLLSLILISPTENRVYQWTLESREEELWTSCIRNITEGQLVIPLRAVALVDEHLLMESLSKYLVVNLELGTIRELEMDLGEPYKLCSSSQVTSLASVSNCTSKIIIEEKDDNIIVKSNLGWRGHHWRKNAVRRISRSGKTWKDMGQLSTLFSDIRK